MATQGMNLVSPLSLPPDPNYGVFSFSMKIFPLANHVPNCCSRAVRVDLANKPARSESSASARVDFSSNAVAQFVEWQSHG